MNGNCLSMPVSASSKQVGFNACKICAVGVLSLAWLAIGACSPDARSTTAERPDVLIIIVDDLNADLQSFDATIPVGPSIDRIAQRGVTFTRAYAQYPQCNQSRTSLLTSRYPEQTGVLKLKDNFRELTSDLITLPQHFRNNGYFTARVGKVFHQGVPGEVGQDGLDDPLSWDHRVNPKGVEESWFEELHTIVPDGVEPPGLGGLLTWLGIPGDGTDLTDSLVADAAIDIMRRHEQESDEQPMLLAVGFYRPHVPLIVPESLLEQFLLEDIRPPVVDHRDRENKPVMALADRPHQLAMTDRQKREVIQAYRAATSFVDLQVGRLLDELEAQNRLQNTIVVFLSDHGYHLGQHGLWQKGDLFEGSVRTPLIIASDGLGESGSRWTTPVELVDIYPTLLALAGLDAPAHSLAGSNLAEQEESGGQAAYSVAWSRARLTRPDPAERNVMGRSIRTSRYRYTEWGGGEHGVEFYDYETDALEGTNLAGSPEHTEVETMLREMLLKARDQAR